MNLEIIPELLQGIVFEQFIFNQPTVKYLVIVAFINFHALPTVCAAPDHFLPFAVGQGTKTINNIYFSTNYGPTTLICHLFNLKFS